uniref:Uncharacterized protein n=1 Tax=CrAss-like virus sp. ctYsL76 TaxID=2826826 RepID=A0A8S5QMK2_9CAUD|nr:MAG TPA: hypothetical protein [CrAss-like virus sp. ctYsL76]
MKTGNLPKFLGNPVGSPRQRKPLTNRRKTIKIQVIGVWN